METRPDPEVVNEPERKKRKRFSVKLLPRLIWTAIVIAIFTPIMAAPMILRSLLPHSGRATNRMGSWWCWAVYKAMGLTFSIKGADKVAPGRSYIVTPNHQGNADILALIATLPVPFRWVIKKSLLHIPLFGWALGRTGAISLDRSNPAKSINTLKGASSKLKGGWSVLIYPEGTRSSDPHVQPFKKGAFMLAVQTGIPILPVTCNGAFHVLPKKTILFIPGHIEVKIGDPIETEGLSVEDVPELMQKTREEIVKNLDVDYNPFNEKWSRLEYAKANVATGYSSS